MSANAPELQPDVDEVLQVEEPAGKEPVVSVRVLGPIRNQILPRKAGATFTRTVGTTVTPTPLLPADHRRAVAYLVSKTVGFRYAFTSASAQDPSQMAEWPAGIPLTITTATAVWVTAATGTTAVSVSTELWAVGEGAE